jgi:hypothetical protein
VVDYSVIPPKLLLTTKSSSTKDFKSFRSALRNRCYSATVFRLENRFDFQGFEYLRHKIMNIIKIKEYHLIKSTTPSRHKSVRTPLLQKEGKLLLSLNFN